MFVKRREEKYFCDAVVMRMYGAACFLSLGRRGKWKKFLQPHGKKVIKNVFATPCLGQETVEGFSLPRGNEKSGWKMFLLPRHNERR
jgi:hypothetical protein